MRVLRNGIDIPDHDLKALQHDLLNIEEWVQDAITAKIYACRARLIDQWFPVILADRSVTSVPADEAAIVNLITNRPDYMNRADREAASAESSG